MKITSQVYFPFLDLITLFLNSIIPIYYFVFHAIGYKGKVNLVGIRRFFEGPLFTTVPRTAQRKRVMPKNTRGTQVDVKRS